MGRGGGVGSISSRYGGPGIYPPPNYGWITGLWHLSVMSHPVFMQITMRGEKLAEFVALQKIKPVSKDEFFVGIFWIVQGKA